MSNLDPRFVFFGSDDFSVAVLDSLMSDGLIPNLVVSTPDMPAGRGRRITPPPAANWAQNNNITLIQPESLDPVPSYLNEVSADFFLVASYRMILPASVYSLPAFKTINIHPSLLPRHRGPTPIQTAILNDEEKTGSSLILIDHKIDHGPLLGQTEVSADDLWYGQLSDLLARRGAQLLTNILPEYLNGKLKPKPQEESLVTWTGKLSKEDGLIDPLNQPRLAYLKIKAYTPWPGAYFFVFEDNQQTGRRIIVKDATWQDNKLILKKIIPAGGKLINWDDFKKTLPSDYHLL